MANVVGTSADLNTPAVSGTNTAGGDGVSGTGRRGVVGISDSYQGVYGKSVDNAGIVGESDKLHGIFGVCHNPNGAGVYGTNDTTGFGLQGVCSKGRGVTGASDSGPGIYGESKSASGGEGWSGSGYGLAGQSQTSAGIRGTSQNGTGTEGWSTNGVGVFATSQNSTALLARSSILAARFEGNIQITGSAEVWGDINFTGGDCAEQFASSTPAEPGTVMVLAAEGEVETSAFAYDKRVVGVVAGAGSYKPGIVLDRNHQPGKYSTIGLLGKVFCKVDADAAPIEVGDLLTTGNTPGHAMKASDPARAFGAILGKALLRCDRGLATIPILITLQ
jgi:hypothetical protein